jgi:hypothetical protein
MIRTYRRALPLVALLVATACQDMPEPVSPDTLPDAAMVRHSEQDLATWFRVASPEVLALRGTVFADHDEAVNKLVFGVENSGVFRSVRAAMARLGIPESAYDIEVTAPIVNMNTLRSRWRPTIAGTQIHFGNYLCTMGFNVSHAGGRSFITNSHCTKKQGGTEGTEYYQPTSSVDPTVIAIEADDPTYFKGGACPRGKQCRYSDSARALYSGSVASEQGLIAKTTGVNNNSLDVTGTFTITSQDNSTTRFALGTVVNKVGRTTGWTRGQVTRTCVDVSVLGSNVAQLCQTFVQDPNGAVIVGSGDSGSGVFRVTSGDNVQLVGILWGGSSDNKTFIYSPLKQIQDELGPMTATR